MELGRGPLQNVRIMNGLDPDFGSKCPDYERRSGQKSPKMSGFLNGNSGGFSGVLTCVASGGVYAMTCFTQFLSKPGVKLPHRYVVIADDTN